MIQMVWRFVRSMLRHQWAKQRGYLVLAPNGVMAYRHSHCATCKFNDEGQCSRCDCLILAKTMMALEKCPDGRWSAVWIKK